MKNMKNMKKLIASIIALIVTTIVIFSAQTVAYFSDGDDIKPIIVIKSANLSGELIERTVPYAGAEPVFGPTNIKIIPGITVEKSVAVKNTGDMGMYVRISVEKDFLLSAENEGKPVDPSLVHFEIDDENWEEKDGFYYYKKPLLHGEVTETLFEKIEFSPQMNNTYTNSTLSFIVTAYATQVSGNGTSVFEAQGWPAVQ